MAKIQSLINTIMQGFSTFTIIPTTNYSKYIPKESENITKEAWQMTSSNLDLIVKSFATKKQGNQ